MATITKRSVSRLHLLTAREVLNAGDGDHSDGGGLLLRVRGGDCSASWVLRFRSSTGRRREVGLGAAHRGNVQQAGAALTTARDLAHNCRGQLRSGIDPIEARDARRNVDRETKEAQRTNRARERWTLARCSRDYHERVIEPNRSDKHGAQWIASLENHIATSVWNKPIGDITAPELLAALLSIKPAARCLELLALCAARTTEALEVRAEELDLDAARWIIPAGRMKAGEAHDVFLPARAVELLRVQVAFKVQPSIILPSTVAEDAPLSNMALLAVLNRMGYRDRTTVHGLRATFSTWAYETDAARPDVIEACLAHSEADKVKAAYNRAKFNDERRTLLAAWAEYLDKPAADILPLRAA